MIELRSVSQVYPSAHGEVRALDGVSLEIARGEFVAIRGPSGSGKTTLLLVVGGLTLSTEGEAIVAGRSLKALSRAERAKFRAAEIGFVFQTFHLLPYLTVVDNVLTAAPDAGRREAVERADNLLERFGLAHRRKHRPGQLSAGERQRVALARALLNEPRIILADEPTGNLDAENGRIVLDLLAEYNRDGGTVLLVTHEELAASRAGRTVLMDRGRIASADAGSMAAAHR
jgi:putative ABC transport system ATP-binding protein